MNEDGAFLVFEKCVKIFFSSANYICRNEYNFPFYTN